MSIKLEIIKFKQRLMKSEMKRILRTKSNLAGASYICRSYSAQYAALINASIPVSVDIEQRRTLSTTQRLAIAHFSCNCADLVLLGRGMELLQIWTMKEAYAKYLLRGVEIDFKQIHIYPVNKVLYIAEHQDFHTITIQSWLTDELAIAVGVGVNQDYFSKFNIKEDVAEHEYYDDRGSEGLFAGEKRDISREDRNSFLS